MVQPQVELEVAVRIIIFILVSDVVDGVIGVLHGNSNAILRKDMQLFRKK